MRFIKALFMITLILCLFGVMGVVGMYGWRAFALDMRNVSEMPERTSILDRNGLLIGKIHGENRTVVPFEKISPYFLMSIIAREDSRFYEHCGVDFKGVARATLRNLKDRNMTQGASTITMQLARNSFDLSQGKEWYHELDRKVFEIFVALRIEWSKEMNKTKILESYCNRIFWGHSMLGIEAASQAYLRKSASDLTLSEGAMLAGIVRGPNAFSPFRSTSLAKRERNTVLDRLVYYGYVTEAEAKTAKAEPLRIAKRKRTTRKESYAMDAIKRELSYHLTKHNIRVGGLTIHTTIDYGLQKVAEESINTRLKAIEQTKGYRHQTQLQYRRRKSNQAPSYLQGALLCIDNETGGVVVAVGGRDAKESRFNRAYSAKRQVGSLFKPFVFQAAFDRGLRPETWIDDSRLKEDEVDFAHPDWDPNNSDGRYKGLVKAQEALIDSRNTSSVRVGDYATMEHVQYAAEIAGFDLFQFEARSTEDIPDNATAYLGAWEATPYEVARAYTVFPNNGTYKRPYIISKIVEKNGKTINLGQLLMADDPLTGGATHEVARILKEINISGTGKSLGRDHGFQAPSAGKTGTTDDYKDAWYAGYTSALTCAVWVGLDTPKKIINKGYGSKLALPIWADLMKAASVKSEFHPKAIIHPLKYNELQLCRRSARVANQFCVSEGDAYLDWVPSDLTARVNRPCTIHIDPNQKIVYNRGPEIRQKSREVGRKIERTIGGFLGRLLGGKIEVPQSDQRSRPQVEEVRPVTSSPRVSYPHSMRGNIPRAIVVEEERQVPQRAIIVEEYAHPPRAIIVE